MEFVVPPVDSSVFFPISVQFAATSTYSGLKVWDLKKKKIQIPSEKCVNHNGDAGDGDDSYERR